MTRKYDFIRLLIFLAGVVGIIRFIDALAERRKMPGIDRFDKFTNRARKVLHLAQKEAQRLQHNYIGTEHLLLGLTREGEGVAAKVLKNDFGIELNKARSAVESLIGQGEHSAQGKMSLTPRAKSVIEMAV